MSSRLRNTERTAKIIEAATQLFAHQGYHGTTTREIADLADMSENTLFRQFGGKEDIFWAALREGLNGLHLRKDLLDSIAQGDLPEVVLPKLFSSLVGTITFKPQILSLIAVAVIELRWKAESVCRVQLAPIFADFSRYLTTSIKNGRIRNLDPIMVTAALGMTALVHPLLSRLLTGGPPPHSDNRDAVRAYTNFWLEVLAPLPANNTGPVMGASKSEPAEPELSVD
jgi:AcrR family transcriptional regulator